MSSWTDERNDFGKRLYADGLSASQIAAALGGITRNAVIGKAHRAKWDRPPVVAPSHPAPRRPRMSNRTLAFAGMLPIDRAAPEPYRSVLSADDIPRQQRKTMATLGERHCRFPYGDPHGPDFFFCGAVRKNAELPIDRGGAPYCGPHCGIAGGGYGRSLEGFKPS